MFFTKNHLSESTRANVTALLQKRLADAIDLIQQAKQAHWNVKGETFISLHELFDKVHEDIELSADLIAERIVQLGGFAEGTCQVASKNSTLPKYPPQIVDARDHIEAFSNALSSFTKALQVGIDQTNQWKDHATADILTQILRSVDKSIWFVEAHAPAEKPKVKMMKIPAKKVESQRLSGH